MNRTLKVPGSCFWMVTSATTRDNVLSAMFSVWRKSKDYKRSFFKKKERIFFTLLPIVTRVLYYRPFIAPSGHTLSAKSVFFCRSCYEILCKGILLKKPRGKETVDFCTWLLTSLDSFDRELVPEHQRYDSSESEKGTGDNYNFLLTHKSKKSSKLCMGVVVSEKIIIYITSFISCSPSQLPGLPYPRQFRLYIQTIFRTITLSTTVTTVSLHSVKSFSVFCLGFAIQTIKWPSPAVISLYNIQNYYLILSVVKNQSAVFSAWVQPTPWKRTFSANIFRFLL